MASVSSLAKETFAIKKKSVSEEDKPIQSTCRSSIAQTEIQQPQQTAVYEDKTSGNK